MSNPTPLVTANGIPILYEALGATFHLDELDSDHESGIEAANDVIWDWFGKELKSSFLSSAVDPAPTRRLDFEYVSTYATQLHAPLAGDPARQLEVNNMAKLGRDDYFVSMQGAADPEHASPWTFDFWSEIDRVPKEGTKLPSRAVWSFTVPTDVPSEEFQARVLEIGAKLPVRWGTAGFTYSVNPNVSKAKAFRALYAHARRHPGFDVRFHQKLAKTFWSKLRTISWLTFVKQGLIESPRLDEGADVQLAEVGSAICIRAGAVPARGDTNRLEVPAAYSHADWLVRAIRKADAADLSEGFRGPWSESAIEGWLKRFEHRFN